MHGNKNQLWLHESLMKEMALIPDQRRGNDYF